MLDEFAPQITSRAAFRAGVCCMRLVRAALASTIHSTGERSLDLDRSI